MLLLVGPIHSSFDMHIYTNYASVLQPHRRPRTNLGLRGDTKNYAFAYIILSNMNKQRQARASFATELSSSSGYPCWTCGHPSRSTVVPSSSCTSNPLISRITPHFRMPPIPKERHMKRKNVWMAKTRKERDAQRTIGHAGAWGGLRHARHGCGGRAGCPWA